MRNWDKDRTDRTTGMTKMTSRYKDRTMVSGDSSEEIITTETFGEGSEEMGAEVDMKGDQTGRQGL